MRIHSRISETVTQWLQVSADRMKVSDLTDGSMHLKLRFRDREASDKGLGVMCETDAVHAVS